MAMAAKKIKINPAVNFLFHLDTERPSNQLAPLAIKIITGGRTIIARSACGIPSPEKIAGNNPRIIQANKNISGEPEISLKLFLYALFIIFLALIITPVKNNRPIGHHNIGSPERLCRQL